MPATPMLGDIELEQVQQIQTDGDEILAQHAIPALEGDFLQRLGRRAARVMLQGVLVGPDARDHVETLRKSFRTAQPVEFVADITTATKVGKVLIEELVVRELAGKPERFEYTLTVREFIQPPTQESYMTQVDTAARQEGEQQALQQVDEIAHGNGGITVQVDLSSGLLDYSGLVVLVEGTTDAGNRLSFTITEQINGIYSRDDVPAGTYTVEAVRR